MLSKNNNYLQDIKQKDSKQRFALRKLTVGVASVLLGTVVFMGSSAVHADTVTANEEPVVSQPTNTNTASTSSAQGSISSVATPASAATSATPATSNANSGSASDGSQNESGAITDRTNVADPNPHTGIALNFNDGTWKQGNVTDVQNSAVINGQHFTINTGSVSTNSANHHELPIWWSNIDGHTFSFSHGGMSTTYKHGGPALSTPTVYSRTLKNGQAQIARQWDLGNQVSMTELYNVTTDGLMEHLIYVTNNGSTPYEFKGLDWDLDTMLDDNDQIPIIADGHGGAYIVGDITLWLQPMYGVSEYSHRWNYPDEQRKALQGIEAGKTTLDKIDTAIDYQFKDGTVAPGKTMVWGFRECLFPKGMDPITNGIVRVTYVDQAGNEVGQTSSSFHKIGDSYTTEAKNIHGYHLISSPANASGTVKFGTIEVNYVYARDAAKGSYQFVDDDNNGAVVGTPQVVNGYVDQTVDVHLSVPTNYQLANGQTLPTKLTFNDVTMAPISIHLVHQTEAVPEGDQSLKKDVIRTINVVTPSGQTKTESQTVTLHRTGTKDKVTNHVTYSNWSTAQWPEYTAESIKGYTAPTVQSANVNGDTKDTTVTVHYTANTQNGKISYVDQDGKEVGNTPLDGKTGESINVSGKIKVPAGWKQVSGQTIPTTIIVSQDGVPTVTVKVEHATVIVTPDKPKTPSDKLPDNLDQHFPEGVAKDDLNKTVTRTINVTKPDGTVTTEVQTSQSKRTATVDEVTNQVTYGEWQDGQWKVYKVPTISGYTPSQAEVPAAVANKDTSVEISYNGNATNTTVTYIDADNGNQPIGQPTTINGKVGQTISISIPKGYTHFSGPTSYTFTAQNKPLTVVLKHETKVHQDKKTITEKIVYVVPGQDPKLLSQYTNEVTFTRDVTTDLVTGKVTYSAWNKDSYTFEGHSENDIKQAINDDMKKNKISLPAEYELNESDLQKATQKVTVTPDSSDVTITIGSVKQQQVDYLTIEYDYIDDNSGNLQKISSTPIYGSHLSGDNKQMIINQYKLSTITNQTGTYTFSPNSETINRIKFVNGIGYEPSDGKYPGKGNQPTIHLLYQAPATTETNTKVTVKYVLANGQQLLPDQTVDSYDANKVKKVIVSGGHIYKLVSGNTDPGSNGQVTLQYQKIR